ncbi:cytochrome P450 [Stachybotrys elegans]|uniref:Cytochrome P450 n=1 Tax=Stachybotrys elegans TaxID=80388 RepID=A0A8K0SWE8_9HYPO|nr:cytochrome P450 [Stachybotrys elegans]
MNTFFPTSLSTAIFAATFPAAALLIWRLWMFTIRPWIWPSEPKTVPYWIPFFGHFYSFFSDCHQLIDDSVRYFADTKEPFAFQLCGVTIYCLSNPEHVTGILDGAPWTHGMDFTHFISEIMQKFGVSLHDVRRAEYSPQPGDEYYIEGNRVNPKNLSLIHFVEDLYKRQFLEPNNLGKLSKVFVNSIQRTLQFEQLEFDFCTKEYNSGLYSAEQPESRREVSLYSLVAGTMVEATLHALFGPYLHRVEPDIVNQVIQFNAHAWILFYGLPDLFGLAPVCGPRDRIKAAFRAFIRLPEEQRSEQCYAFENLLKWMEVLNMEEESRIGLLFLFFFASIANEQNACYWFVAHMIYDKSLLEVATHEIAPAWESGELDVDFLISKCPTLDAIFNETLRQRTNTFGWRVVKEKTTICGKLLQPGVPVMVPMRLLHTNKEAWGSTVDVFDPSRFIRKKTLARQPSYRPFASGPTYCPGRILAKRETYAFIATLLHRYSIELLHDRGRLDGKQQFPLMEVYRPPTGVKGPLPGMDLHVGLQVKKE